MKNLVQVQQELNTYFEKTSQHVFVKKVNNKDMFFRLFDTKTKDGKTIWMGIILDEELSLKDITFQFNMDRSVDENTKNVQKHQLFLNEGYHSVRLKRKTQHIVDAIKETVSTIDAPLKDWRAIGQFKKDIIEKVLLAQ